MKAERNKTIDFLPEDAPEYLARCLRVTEDVPLDAVCGRTICGDTFQVAPHLPRGFADLLIVDPPYNLTKDFSGGGFRRTTDANYAAFTRREVVVVFDGYRVPGGQGEKFDRSGLHVVFTRQGETADAYMEKLADEIGKNESVRVVTSDALIQLTALRAGVLRMSAREFRQELAQVAQQLEAAIRDINGR